MRFEHKIRVEAPKDKVEAFLNDFERAALCLPGVTDVKPAGDGLYEGKVRVKVGPLGFNIAGRARPESRPDGAWSVQGEGRDPRVGAGVKAALEARSVELGATATEVQVSADIQFSGALAGLGQPLIKKKADAMVQEFAENLRRAIGAT
jgi:carbon-monoxide dehydrogenase small subunit